MLNCFWLGRIYGSPIQNRWRLQKAAAQGTLEFTFMDEAPLGLDPVAETGLLTKAERKRLRREEKQRQREAAERRRGVMRAARWVALLAGAAAVVGAVVLVSGRGEKAAAPGEAPRVAGAVTEADWTKGAREAPAVLIEYGDFQCPACRAYYPVVKELSGELKERLLVAYRHFPLRQPHPQAQLAAQAAEAAGRQGKFWEMHDVLFERQGDWANNNEARAIFGRYAEELGLDRGRWEADLEEAAIRDKIESDYRSGLTARVDSTPTFFLNGEKLQGFRNFDEFRERIRAAAGA